MFSVPVTTLFVGLFALGQVVLTVLVGYRRVQTRIQFLDGGDLTLLRRMRAHANYTETVPMVLLAMLCAEASGTPAWAVGLAGASLLLGRLMHAVILMRKGHGVSRAIGMLLTLAPMLGMGACAILGALRAWAWPQS